MTYVLFAATGVAFLAAGSAWRYALRTRRELDRARRLTAGAVHVHRQGFEMIIEPGEPTTRRR